MDLLNVVDAALIGVIMGMMEIVKSVDKDHKNKRFYPLVVLVLAVIAALVKSKPLDLQTFGYNAMLYVGASSYIFKFAKTTVMGK